ncbi:hypothetical protein WBP07_18105 [Novosphingobium sp. BL-8A]|uniref:hypothetical protein n=1 Tax=Novosphingobium sp. BL-8A TaxID=3127639 RepID=UPI003757F7CA
MTLAFDPLTRDDIRDEAVRKAVGSLVRASTWGASYLVTVPMIYPSGAVVGVKITPEAGGYWVSDFAMGYREAEAIDAQRSFGAHAGKAPERYGVEYTVGHEIRMFATERQLTTAIRRVAAASHDAATKAHNSLPEMEAHEIGAVLYQRLRDMFGADHVKGETKIAGASNLDWPFAAEVTLGERRVLFDAVVPHHSSVVFAKSKFSDIRRLGPETHPVAVVESFAKMSKWLPLISQEAEVIEAGVGEDVLRKVVAEAA